MRHLHRLAAVAGILAFVTVGHADTILRQRSFDLSRAGDPTYFQNYKTQVLGIGTDDEGSTSAQLLFPQPTASLGRMSTTAYEDWSPYNILEFKLTNHENFTTEFRALVYLTSEPHNSTGVFSGRIIVGPNETRRFCCYLNPDDSMPYGMEYLRPVLSAPYNNVYSAGGFRDLRTIYTWRISYQGTVPAHVDVSDLRLIKQDLTFDGMVDRFGQYADREWPNKVHSTSDFATLQANELTDLAAHPCTGEQLGSDSVALANSTPGKWRVATSNSGMKYLQHPDGKALWVLGVSAIHNGTPTPVGGRENYFQSLPSATGTYASCFYTRPTLDGTNVCFSFHQQNLMYKYGSNYMTPWTNMVKQRLSSWGLNTVGMQCLDNFYDGSLPYNILLSSTTFPTRLKVPKQLWGSLPDPFDPSFQSWMSANFAKDLAAQNGKENFMGVYVDNELSWGNTFTQNARFNIELGILKSPSTQPAKIAFVNWLNARYKGSIDDLNAAWGTSFGSFDSILTSSWQPPSYPLSDQNFNDFKAFTRVFARKYFAAVRGALTQDGLTGLYLGCRYADWLPEIVEEADNYVDVHTLNFYKTSGYMNWKFFSIRKKPFMFSELGFSVQADGTFGGVGEVYSQADRAKNLADILRRANQEPNCVGAVLYCYTDQPITGRYSDYENSGLGLVDVTDTPHYETVNFIRDFSRSMYVNRN